VIVSARRETKDKGKEREKGEKSERKKRKEIGDKGEEDSCCKITDCQIVGLYSKKGLDE
jgi:hypothetical protein